MVYVRNYREEYYDKYLFNSLMVMNQQPDVKQKAQIYQKRQV